MDIVEVLCGMFVPSTPVLTKRVPSTHKGVLKSQDHLVSCCSEASIFQKNYFSEIVTNIRT